MKTLFKILYFLWFTLVPILLAIGLGIGVFFNLVYVQDLPIWLAVILAIVITLGLGLGITKLLQIW